MKLGGLYMVCINFNYLGLKSIYKFFYKLSLLSIIFFILGCSSKYIAPTDSLPKKTKFDNHLYVENDFNNSGLSYNIVTGKKDNFGFRLDDLAVLGTYYTAYDEHKDKFYFSYLDQIFGGSESSNEKKIYCKHLPFGKTKTYPLEGLKINLIWGIATLGIGPLFSGFPYPVRCVVDEEKYNKSLTNWLNNSDIDRLKLLKIYNNQLKLAKALDEYGRNVFDLNSNFYHDLVLSQFPCDARKNTKNFCNKIILDNNYTNKMLFLKNIYFNINLDNFITKLTSLEKNLSILSKVEYIENNETYEELLKKIYPCKPNNIPICVSEINNTLSFINLMKKNRISLISIYKNNESIDKLSEIVKTLKLDMNLKPYLIPKIVSGIRDVNGDYEKLNLSLNSKIYFEDYIYNDAVSLNTIQSLNSFLVLFPYSTYKDKIKNKIYQIRYYNVLEELKSDLFYVTDWYSIKWEGKVKKVQDKTSKYYNFPCPNGDGHFELFRYKPLSFVSVYATMKNCKIDFSKENLNKMYVESYVGIGHFFRPTEFSKSYSKNFFDIKSMNDAILETLNKSIRYFNGEKLQSNFVKISCTSVFNKCKEVCNKKSSKGFFDNQSSCINTCYSGKNYCEKGRVSFGIRLSCDAMCKGLNTDDGELFGWGWSSKRQCEERCIENIKKLK